MKKLFGTLPTGEEVYLYTLTGKNTKVDIITYGAAVQKFVCFGTDIVGGFDELSDYVRDDSYQGAIIGRVANRIANATVTIDGVDYHFPKNDGENTLHGGIGFDKKVWNVTSYNENSISLSYTAPDGENGFPGNLQVKVTYTLADDALVIEYNAVSDKKTPIALTNHSYFNLNGFGKDIKNHKLKIYADRYTEVDENLIPNGNRPSVSGTPFDFTDMHEIGERMFEGISGYDHNLMLAPVNSSNFLGKEIPLVAEAEGDTLKLSVYTDRPCMQFYSGNFLANNPDFKGGVKVIKHGAFCLEAQTEPDCINHGEAIYDAGVPYAQTTVYKVEKI